MTEAEGRALIQGRPAHRHEEAGPGDAELWPRIEAALRGHEEPTRAVGYGRRRAEFCIIRARQFAHHDGLLAISGEGTSASPYRLSLAEDVGPPAPRAPAEEFGWETET